MDMKLKGLIKTNGSYYYQRSVPKQLSAHPFFNRKHLYKKPLGAKLETEDAIYEAWKKQHEAFEALIRNLKKANLPLLEQRQLTAEAINLLRAHNLKEGSLVPDPNLSETYNQQIIEATHLKIDHSGLLDEATEYHNKVDYGEIGPDEVRPHHIQVADEAWRLLNIPKTMTQTKNYLLSDCLGFYIQAKNLDPSNRQTRKTINRWKAFLEYSGDCLLSVEEIHTRLDDYVNYRESCREKNLATTGKATPSSSTIQKEVDMVVAIINVVNKKNRLGLVIDKPTIQKTEATTREILTPDEVKAIIEEAKKKIAANYSPWKELAILILAQTSCISSELQRMKKTALLLDVEVPAIRIEGITKTKNRYRMIPLVYELERIRELVDMESSEYILGEVADTSESNISAQLNKIIKSVNPKATAYSFRHTFKHNANIQNVDHQFTAYLGGWSGAAFGVNDIMMNYGKSGIDTPEMLKRLQSEMKKIYSHLLNK